MKYNQIATLMNSIFGELIGEDGLFAEDLSNVADVGRVIISTTQWDENFENYVRKIVDKVGRVILWDRTYSGDDLGLLREAWEYGSILEKIRVEVGDFVENKVWQLPDTPSPDFSGLFDFDSPAEVDAKYFNSKTTFAVKICIMREQANSAFKSAEDLARFIGSIENRIRTKMEMSKEALAYRCEANLIIEKVKANNGVYNVLLQYIMASGDSTIDAENYLQNIEFLRFAYQHQRIDMGLMRKANRLFNVDGYTTFTPGDRLNVYALSDFAAAMESVLRSQTYHDEFVTLPGYREVPFWQAIGTGDYATRSTITAIPASESGALSPTTYTQPGIIFVMQDKDAAMICCEAQPVDSLYNPEGRFYKYFYRHDASYYNDLAENCIVYVAAPGVLLKVKEASVAVSGTVDVSTGMVHLPSTGTVSYTSSATGKATVNASTGVVTGVAAGETIITASTTVNGITYTDTCKVTVTST